MMRHLKYLKSVLRHKWYVFLACLQFRVPIWIAILHDWDKFLPDEWLPYARTFYALDGSKQYVESVDFARAWMKHQHRNKHHWQYWVGVYGVNLWGSIREVNILVWDRGIGQEIVECETASGIRYELRDLEGVSLSADPMPDRARREMLADWFGAGRAYDKDWTPLEPRKWYEKNKDKMILHPETRAWVESELERREADYRNYERMRTILGM